MSFQLPRPVVRLASQSSYRFEAQRVDESALQTRRRSISFSTPSCISSLFVLGRPACMTATIEGRERHGERQRLAELKKAGGTHHPSSKGCKECLDWKFTKHLDNILLCLCYRGPCASLPCKPPEPTSWCVHIHLCIYAHTKPSHNLITCVPAISQQANTTKD